MSEELQGIIFLIVVSLTIGFAGGVLYVRHGLRVPK